MKYVSLAVVATVLAGAANADPVLYQNNFNGGSAAGFTGATAVSTTPTGERYLELYQAFSNPSTGVTNLVLDTSGVSFLTLTFDLYSIRSTDGDGQAGGASDPFRISVGGTTIFDYTFANYSANTQSFPTPGSAPRTGASANGTLGYGTGDYGDATYAITLTFVPTAGSTTIQFVGGTNEDEGNESYGLDNLTVTGVPNANPGVPEPSSWAMMIAGFGLVGAAARRRGNRTIHFVV